MSQSEPRMKAMPASTKSWSRISAAAIRLPTKPVSEIAFGVSRDSISLLRATARISAAVRPARPLPRGGRSRSRRARCSSPSLTW
jgi:hypothetical protein